MQLVQNRPRQPRWRVWTETLAYHLTRRFPAWAGWLPAHTAEIKPVSPSPLATTAIDGSSLRGPKEGAGDGPLADIGPVR